MLVLKKQHIVFIHGGVQIATDVHNVGLDNSLDCRCYCECFDRDIKSISDESEAGFFSRWLWYYPAAVLNNVFYFASLRS